jgi:hypothetical protein
MRFSADDSLVNIAQSEKLKTQTSPWSERGHFVAIRAGDGDGILVVGCQSLSVIQ